MNSASYVFDDPAPADQGPMIERNTLLWGSFLIGLVMGFVIVYMVAAQPMFAKIHELQQQTTLLEGSVQSLVGVRDQAWEAGNLLADLKAMKAQLVDARESVREIRQLRQDLLEESRHVSSASQALVELARLQDAVLEQQELTAPALRAVDQMGAVQSRLVQQHSVTPQAEIALDGLDQLRSQVGTLFEIARQIAANGDSLPGAETAAGQLIALKDQLIKQGDNFESARTQANRLFILQEELRSHAEDAPAAFTALDGLLTLKDRLLDQTTQIADAVQTLEILSDFQADLTAQIESFGKIRSMLTEIVLLETTVGRVAKALEPLTQLVNVRRLGDQELRAAARAILDSRATRLGSQPESPRQLPRTAENERLDLPVDEDPFTAKAGEAGVGGRKPVPDPVALPEEGEQPASH